MNNTLRMLCNASGAGGHTAVSEVVKALVSDYADEVRVDALGNVIATRKCGKEGAPVLLLEAHIDEIGFIVTHVDEDGFVHVSNCGGIDRRVLAAAEVTLLTEPPLAGVFCSTPPHLAGEDGKLKPLDEMGIDIGYPAEEAKALVEKGTRGVFRAHFEELSEHLVCAKALDDRVGCAAVIEAMRLLKDEDLSCDVTALFAVQEEVGGAGATVAAFGIDPSAAIATDVSFAVTPDATPHKCGKLGEGPMIGVSPTLDYALTEQIKAIAKRCGIAVQYEVMGGSTGTDADSIFVSKCGVPTALLSIPQRYMHTPIEVIDVRDAKGVAKLMAEVAKEGIASC
ncbi:MAG: M42 family metallopeptidase [Ruminococcaceae bacterium]|nr:M42 family metallopeptidase [Oscillospiraceae bacterium]